MARRSERDRGSGGPAEGQEGRALHKLILGQINEDVHLVLLHHAEDGADVVVLQHRAVVVQDGAVRPGTRGAMAKIWGWGEATPGRQPAAITTTSLRDE